MNTKVSLNFDLELEALLGNKARRHDDQHPSEVGAHPRPQLLQNQSGLDRLSEPDLIGEYQARLRLLQSPEGDGYLVKLRIDAGVRKPQRQIVSVRVEQTKALALEPAPVRVGHLLLGEELEWLSQRPKQSLRDLLRPMFEPHGARDGAPLPFVASTVPCAFVRTCSTRKSAPGAVTQPPRLVDRVSRDDRRRWRVPAPRALHCRTAGKTACARPRPERP
jgi:hypothetical protein